MNKDEKVVNNESTMKYDAFISYRHMPADIRVAKEIQNRLENYIIPKELARKIGKKKIGKIFRDKEELPITSDLSQNIEQALNNSHFLIVICSPDTKNSVWVQREIDFFLKNHSRKNVLTVLVAGEPVDVIPEILLEEEYYDPNTDSLEKRLVEPLSCDYRIPVRRARREELPRLAAAVIGCGYDELINRQKQYRTRRIISVMAVALFVLTSFLIYAINRTITISKQAEQIEKQSGEIEKQSKEIEKQAENIYEEYQKALINQSMYLSAESLQSEKEQDVNTAILLALAAFPKEDDDRPLIPEAELALTRALNSYSPGKSYGYNVGTRVIRNRYYGNGEIIEFYLNNDKSSIILLDESGVINVRDVQTGSLVSSINVGADFAAEYTHQIILTEGDNILAVSDARGIECYKLKTGELLWEKELGTLANAYYMRQTDELWLSEKGVSRFFDNEEDLPYLMTVLSADTGETIRSVEIREDGLKDEYNYTRKLSCLNSRNIDGSNVLLMSMNALYASDDSKKQDKLFVVNSDDGDYKYVRYRAGEVIDSMIMANGDVVLVSRMNYTGENNLLLRCYDGKSLSEKWTFSGQYNFISDGTPGILEMPNETILFTVSDRIVYLNSSNGNVLQEKRIKLDDKITGAFVEDDAVRIITKKGSQCYVRCDYRENQLDDVLTTQIYKTKNDLIRLCLDVQDIGLFLLEYNSDSVMFASYDRVDESYTMVARTENPLKTFCDEQHVYIFYEDNVVAKFNMELNDFEWKIKLPTIYDETDGNEILENVRANRDATPSGIYLSNDKDKLFMLYREGIRTIDTATGKTEATLFGENEELEELWRNTSDYVFTDDSIICVKAGMLSNGRLQIAHYDIASKETRWEEFETEADADVIGIRYLGGKLYFIQRDNNISWLNGNELMQLDMDIFFDSATGLITCYSDDSKTILVGAGAELGIFDYEGNKRGKIILKSAISGATFSENGSNIYVIDERGNVGKYDLNGTPVIERLIDEADGGHIYNTKWYFTGDTIVLQSNFGLHFLEKDTLKKRAESSFGDWYFDNKIYGYFYDEGYSLIFYNMKTPQELRDEALEVSKNCFISNPERYGLE